MFATHSPAPAVPSPWKFLCSTKNILFVRNLPLICSLQCLTTYVKVKFDPPLPHSNYY